MVIIADRVCRTDDKVGDIHFRVYVDSLDDTPFSVRPADEVRLEGFDPAGAFEYDYYSRGDLIKKPIRK